VASTADKHQLHRQWPFQATYGSVRLGRRVRLVGYCNLVFWVRWLNNAFRFIEQLLLDYLQIFTEIVGREKNYIILLKRRTVASALELFINNVRTLSAQGNIKAGDYMYERRTWHA
jgi:hypothetical protein